MPRMKKQTKSKSIGWSRATVAPAPLKVIEEPSRGVRLSTVSGFTIAFALVCLAALMAGRPPASAAVSEQTAVQEKPMFLGLRTGIYHVKDVAKAKEWYSKVLGIQPYFDQPFYVGFNVGGYELGLIPDEKDTEKKTPSSVAYWGVDDAKGAYQRLLDLGATPQEAVTDVGGGILAGAVYDPFGNVLGVIQNPYFKLPASSD
ncbi:MAG TPA: VOC family protein [Candidatus Acidoferrales bacterium]|nr:VOC family protein [Candidatus Acidoferrales bacterium]